MHAVKVFLLGAFFVVLRGMKVVKVAVGSLNPVKIRSSQEGVRKALGPVFGDEPFEIVVKGFNSPSEVSDQPMGDKETKLGAQNRARNAWAAYQREEGTEPDYSVGLEGGVTLLRQQMGSLEPQGRVPSLYPMRLRRR